MHSQFSKWQISVIVLSIGAILIGSIFTEDPMAELSWQERRAAYACQDNLEKLREGDFVRYKDGAVWKVLHADRCWGRLSLRHNQGQVKTIDLEGAKHVVKNWREVRETFQRRYLNQYMLKDVMDDFEKQH